jgi:hypothetical protein
VYRARCGALTVVHNRAMTVSGRQPHVHSDQVLTTSPACRLRGSHQWLAGLLARRLGSVPRLLRRDGGETVTVAQMNELGHSLLMAGRRREEGRSCRSEVTRLLFAARVFSIGITSAGRGVSSVTVLVKSIAKRSPPTQKITRECLVVNGSGSWSRFGWPTDTLVYATTCRFTPAHPRTI